MNRMTLLVNAFYSHARTRLLSAIRGLDNKRSRAWCEYGYKDQLTFEDYYAAYDRQALGNAAVELKTDTVWGDLPYIAEGSDEETLDKDSPNESAIAQHLKKIHAWDAFKQADLMRHVGGHSYLIARIADNQPLSAPIRANSLAALVELVPVWKGQIMPSGTRNQDGTPAFYTYKQPLPDGATADVDVHPDRLIPFGDVRNGRPLLKAGFNHLVNIEKITGGSGESFLKNAARQMNVNFDPDIDLKDIADAYGLKDVGELQKAMNETARELNTGNDILLMTQGAQASAMVSTVPDPSSHFAVNLQCFAASVKTPVKILIGQITGERASTEDIKSYNKVCQAWRENECDRALRAVLDRLIKFGFLNLGDYTIVWPDLTDGDMNEKADTANKLGALMQTLAAAESAELMTGREPLLSRDELRSLLGL